MEAALQFGWIAAFCCLMPEERHQWRRPNSKAGIFKTIVEKLVEEATESSASNLISATYIELLQFCCSL